MRLLACDLLIADIIVPIAASPALVALADEYGLVPGGKTTLDDKGLAAFSEGVRGLPVAVAPGGSSANMLATLCRILPGAVSARFLGVAGAGEYGDVIRRSLGDAGVALLPEPAGGLPALSFVLLYPDGQCTIATHPGNARALITPELISEREVQAADTVLVQGSLWHKFAPGVADRMVALARAQGKKLWLTLPTQPALGADYAARIRTLLPQAALVLGNEAELERVFACKAEEAIAALQQCLGDKALAFVTFGAAGAVVVTARGAECIASEPVAAEDIVSTLGAGDTAYAGFAAGLLSGRTAHDAALAAMHLAAAKLRIRQPRLPDPRAVFTDF